MTDTTRREVLGWLAGLGAAAGAGLLLPGQAGASTNVTALRDVTLIDSSGVRSNTTIVLADNEVLAVGSCDLPLPRGSTVLDLAGKFVIPGLWDMHVHGAYMDRITLPLCLANGVTGIREMWGFPPIYELRDRIERGEVLGPRLIVGSTIIDGPNSTLPDALIVSTPDEGRQAVRDAKAQGADFVKVYSFLDRATLAAVADECAMQAITFAGHCSNHVALGDASDLGQRTFEHMYGLPLATSTRETQLRQAIADLPLDPANPFAWFRQVLEFERQAALSHSGSKAAQLAKRLQRNTSALVPTMVTMRVFASPLDRFANDPRLKYMPAFYRDFWRDGLKNWAPVTEQEIRQQVEFLRRRMDQVAEMHAHGVEVLAGTDAGNPYTFPGFSLHDELELLVEAGLPPKAALKAGTRGGVVKPGEAANLVVLDGNPLKDIRNTQRIHTVLTRGKVLGPAERRQMLADVEKAAQEPFPAAARTCC
ncbi:amidohydrolase family protein [Lentzea sp. BCCO 10_0061]|uniref:Amidohydrolase family protein n=1 Tax=Lentzea sokolovensis TaxID=3095429 RepID=A0ABU4UY16_9PSEU|nr:amidohydrolase family protein [Lentzea sp. BCCO 10_0061]MDX8144354.1 amidohydrolase family protein [Lentzea sp. BCCO 10_0061]